MYESVCFADWKMILEMISLSSCLSLWGGKVFVVDLLRFIKVSNSLNCLDIIDQGCFLLAPTSVIDREVSLDIINQGRLNVGPLKLYWTRCLLGCYLPKDIASRPLRTLLIKWSTWMLLTKGGHMSAPPSNIFGRGVSLVVVDVALLSTVVFVAGLIL